MEPLRAEAPTVVYRASAEEAVWARANPLALARRLVQWRSLIWQMAVREVVGRFRGSYLGLSWVVLSPLLTIGVLTFLFSGVLKVRWGSGHERLSDFALQTLAGLTTFNIFAESTTRSPALVVGRPGLVKRVAFPLETLPVSLVLAVLLQASIGFAMVLTGQLLLSGHIPATTLLMPAVLIPAALLALAAAWLVSAVSVIVRDIGQLAGFGVSLLLFMTPISYPLSAVPARARVFVGASPLAILVEDTRALVCEGRVPDLRQLAWVWVASILLAFLGYAFFLKVKPAFADLL